MAATITRKHLIAFALAILSRDPHWHAPVRPWIAGRLLTLGEVGTACRRHDLPDAFAYTRWDDWARAVRARLRGEHDLGGSVERWVRALPARDDVPF